MKETLKNVSITLLVGLIIFKRPVLMSAISGAITIWINTVFPAIFPFLIISDLIISTNLINLIAHHLSFIYHHLFKMSGYGAYVFLLSLISGTPGNAKYLKDLLDAKLINNQEAIKILSMSLVYNPILIIAITPFLKPFDQLFLIISNIIINIIIGLINRNFKVDYKKISHLRAIKFNLINSINKAIQTLLLILGVIVFFAALASLLPTEHPLLIGILEIINGLNKINPHFSYHHQLLFSGILLSFGSLSIQTQIKSILKDYQLEYSLFYKSRIIHLILFILFIQIRLLII